MPKCMDPVLCYRGQKKTIYRHFSLASPMVKALHQTVFNCGKCIFCRKRRAAELAVRCVLHSSLYKDNCFLTLTYDEKKPEYHNNFQYSDIQEFKKKLRSWVKYHHEKTIQLFNVHEYGKNGKKHWHLICFNYDFPDKEIFTIKNGNYLYTSKKLEKRWKHGFCTIGNVTEASALYQAQYSQKDFKNGNANNERKSHSKHSGIGREYFLRHYKQILVLGYVPFGGRKAPVPRYFVRLAHKHFCHFYEPSAFWDLPTRRRLYNPFKGRTDFFYTDPDAPNREIADLYLVYSDLKKEYLSKITSEWEEVIFQDLFDKTKKDFQLSGENFLYDLKNRGDDASKF